MNETTRRLNDAHTEWSKHLDINGNPSFGVWLLNRAESAEARAKAAEQSFSDTLADLKAMMQERDELRAKLEREQRKIDALSTQLGTPVRP